MNQKASQRQYIPVRRVLTGALAAALTLACLFTVALAASPELRMAVMTFFHMEEPERLPSADPGGALTEPGVSQKDIGQLVKAQYIEMDHYHGLAGDLLNDLTWSEDGRTLLDAKFWEVKDNEVIPVEVDLHTQQVDVTYNSIRYQGELYWYVRNGTLWIPSRRTSGTSHPFPGALTPSCSRCPKAGRWSTRKPPCSTIWTPAWPRNCSSA